MGKRSYKLLGVIVILVVGSISYILVDRYAEYKAEKVKQKKIVAENMAKFNHWKSLTDIGEKAASLNRKIGEIGDISKESEIRNFESSNQLLDLLTQKRKLHEEYNRIKGEDDTYKQFDAWMGVDAARDSWLESQIQVNALTSKKSELEKILSESENGK